MVPRVHASLARQPFTSGLGKKERLVTFARYSRALPECWQSQSDCTAADYDVTSHGLPY